MIFGGGQQSKFEAGGSHGTQAPARARNNQAHKGASNIKLTDPTDSEIEQYRSTKLTSQSKSKLTQSSLGNGFVYDQVSKPGKSVRNTQNGRTSTIPFDHSEELVKSDQKAVRKVFRSNSTAHITMPHSFKGQDPTMRSSQQLRKSSQFNGARSTGMGKILSSNPQNGEDTRKSKYIQNSGAPMRSLKDLQGPQKYAAMKTSSTAFQGMYDQAKPPMKQSSTQDAGTFSNRKRNSTAIVPVSTMSGLMAHNDGEITRFTTGRFSLAGKVSGQNNSNMKSATMQRVMGAKHENVRSKASDIYGKSQIF